MSACLFWCRPGMARERASDPLLRGKNLASNATNPRPGRAVRSIHGFRSSLRQMALFLVTEVVLTVIGGCSGCMPPQHSPCITSFGCRHILSVDGFPTRLITRAYAMPSTQMNRIPK
jgi:hypothetical protein